MNFISSAVYCFILICL